MSPFSVFAYNDANIASLMLCEQTFPSVCRGVFLVRCPCASQTRALGITSPAQTQRDLLAGRRRAKLRELSQVINSTSLLLGKVGQSCLGSRYIWVDEAKRRDLFSYFSSLDTKRDGGSQLSLIRLRKYPRGAENLLPDISVQMFPWTVESNLTLFNPLLDL